MSYECGVLHAAQVSGTTQDHLQVFNIESKTKMKSHQMTQQVQNLSMVLMPVNVFVPDNVLYWIISVIIDYHVCFISFRLYFGSG